MGLKHGPKAIDESFEKFALFYALGLGLDWQGLWDGLKMFPTTDTLAQQKSLLQ